MSDVITGILIPFIGTALGSSLVLFMKKTLNSFFKQIMSGFAAGVMVAASVWSLILPALEQSASLGKLAFLPATAGFWSGILFLLFLDNLTPHICRESTKADDGKPSLKKLSKLILAVTIHNIPEGMAVGVAYAALLYGKDGITAVSALALATGIGIQNFPEGAIISMPLRSEGLSRKDSFISGVLSGAVEPVAAFFTILATGFVVPILPYLLTFAAGAMIYVVIAELIPEMSVSGHNKAGNITFTLGFTTMMILDITLG